MTESDSLGQGRIACAAVPAWTDPSVIDTRLRPRAITFENPTGAEGAGGTAHGGRKGAPNRFVDPGETIVLADVEGPATIRHVWMTFMAAPPEHMRAVWMEVFYDGATEPSVSVPCLDFFGMPLGRPVPYTSVLTSAQEGRGFNSYLPMPFARSCRVELTNSSPAKVNLYFQIDYTLEDEVPDGAGYLHVAFRRENPTTMRRDFVIHEGLEGPGRFLGCNVGVRTIDGCDWYGEGEVKIYLDGDTDLPTICGTGLEDYVGTAWGLGPHHALYAGAPLVVSETLAKGPSVDPVGDTDFVGFYRWHVVDPIAFERDCRVTIQQIGARFFRRGEEEVMAAYEQTNPPAGEGWVYATRGPLLAWGLAERVDDFCATAYVCCSHPQPVPRLDITAAVADIERRPYERPLPTETYNEAVAPPVD